MTNAMDARTYQFRALTDLWTGSVTLEEKNGQIKEKTGPDRLITTGLLGSIRWWFEVLVRGLGGSACDPTDTKCEGEKHCVVCELFGCTGWARKFRFQVLDNNGAAQNGQIKKGAIFKLCFTPLRPIADEEWALLEATLRLIADYGAIGGKTVLKPSNENGRAGADHHKDYGVVELKKSLQTGRYMNLAKAKNYATEQRWEKPKAQAKDGDFSWASLSNFWFIDQKALSRKDVDTSSFNKVLGRVESKVCQDCGEAHNPPNKCPKTKRHPKRESEKLINYNDEIHKWLAGSQQESKKVFSFKDPARTFGFVKPDLIDFEAMKERLTNVWGRNGWNFLAGDKIIDQLFAGKEDRS